ncbi:hypothetical protein BASA82_000743 [Batrachochytrium salamandrivorans]|nr:hypothetical protein BASA82_000743 [Batrachochytrium salamandrivorans]
MLLVLRELIECGSCPAHAADVTDELPVEFSLICVDGLKQDIPSPLLGQLEPEPVLLQAPSHATPHVSLSVTRSRPSLSLNTLQTQPRSIRSSRHSSSNQVHGTTIPLSRTHARQSSAPYMLSPLRRTTELYPDLAWSMPYTTTCNTWTVPLLSPTSAVSTDLFYSNEWARNGLLDSSLASLIYPSPISLTAPVVPQSFTSTSAPAITTVVAHTDIPEPPPMPFRCDSHHS